MKRLVQFGLLLAVLGVTHVSSAQSFPNDSSLVGYWTFDEGTGTTVSDSSGFGQNGSWQGTLGSQWVSGELGPYAGQFNGTNNYAPVTLTGAAAGVLTSFTLSVWMYDPNTLTVRAGGVARGSYASAGNVGMELFLGYICSDVYFVTAHWMGTCGFIYPVPQSTWQFYAITYDGSNLNLYHGATRLTQAAVVGDSVASASDFYLGFSNSFFQGSMDDVRLYNRALSAAEIADLSNWPASITLAETGAVTDTGAAGAAGAMTLGETGGVTPTATANGTPTITLAETGTLTPAAIANGTPAITLAETGALTFSGAASAAGALGLNVATGETILGYRWLVQDRNKSRAPAPGLGGSAPASSTDGSAQ